MPILYRATCALLLAALVSGCFLFRNSLRDQLLDVEMVYVDGGSFLMGDVIEGENDDALPVHEVTVAPFYLSKYEVTYAQYDAFAQATGRPLPPDDGRGRGNRAVAYVTWDDAAAFCASYGYRLPTEQEWEYAARDQGKKMMFAGTNDAEMLSRYAHADGDSAHYALPVGQRRPNALGIHDLSGNVNEWIGAYYQFYPEPGEAPTYSDLETSGIRILRGGSFGHHQTMLRTYWRAGTIHDVQTDTIGFRCAASAD
jgi:formylglycine-generating enzyme required for sulfatase activity